MTDQTARPDSSDSQAPAGGVSRRSLFRAAGVGAAVVGGGAFLEACSSGIQGAASSSSSSGRAAGTSAALGSGDEQGDHDRLDPPADRRRWPGSVTRTTSCCSRRWPPRSSRTGSRSAASTYTVTIKSYDTQSSVTRAGDAGQAGHPAGQRRPAVRLLHPGDRQRRRVPGRDPRHPADLLQHPVGVLVHQPRRQPARSPPSSPSTPSCTSSAPSTSRSRSSRCGTGSAPSTATTTRSPPRSPTTPTATRSAPCSPRSSSPPGYNLDLSTAYTDGLTNYTSMISQFKSHGDDFFTNVPLPPDFATMWTQALQQGFKPKLATVAKVLLFPTDAYAMGSKVYNIATDAWWVPELPWTSSLDRGRPARTSPPPTPPPAWASPTRTSPTTPSSRSPTPPSARSTTRTTRPSSPPRCSRSSSPRPSPARSTTPRTNAKTNPAPGVAITPPVGIQWQKGTKYPLEAKVVDNTLQPNAKITGDLLPTFS